MGAYNKLKTTLLLLLAALLLGGTALGDFEYDFTTQSLDEVIGLYMAEFYLTEEGFSMGWRDLTSGEEYFFNGDKFMFAASMCKLPLNMIYADKLASGELEPDDIVGSCTVKHAMDLSMVYSSNEAADQLRLALKLSQYDYHLLLAQYSGLDESELPKEYFITNIASPRFMLNTLSFLYDNSELYSGIIENMKAANPGEYFKKGGSEYEIAHKYGGYGVSLNDCAIVYTPHPFALVVFTNQAGRGEVALSTLRAIMTDYSLYLDSLPEPAPEPEPTPEPAPTPESEPAPEPEPDAAAGRTASPRPLWTACAAVCTALPALAFVRRRKRRAVRKGDRK